MWKFIGFLCVFISFFQTYGNTEKSKISEIKKKGYLTVAMLGEDCLPYVFKKKNGDIDGIDVKLARLLAEALDVSIKFDRTAKTFDDIVDVVSQGKADIGLSGLSITTKRAEKVSYSNPYVTLRKAFLLSREAFLKKRKKPDDSLQDFFSNGNKIGVMKGNAYEFYARTMFPEAVLVFYDNKDIDTLAVTDLEKGKTDALFRDAFEVQKLIKTRYHGVLNYMAISLEDTFDPFGIIVPQNTPDLLNWINIFLQVQNISYTVDDLMKIFDQQKNMR
ncbi:MAG: ABC transporter substrate-binding protein [Alphaproteobacteria bacterium]